MRLPVSEVQEIRQNTPNQGNYCTFLQKLTTPISSDRVNPTVFNGGINFIKKS
ncbi:MAG: hypothetical protein SPL13_04970 [Clostridia bacterium]|nr:hypothetical protein [Clostridia bacterium]